MARLLAETAWGCSTHRRGKTLSILAVALGIALSGCNRPAAPAADARPHEPSKTVKEPVSAESTQEQTLVVALAKEPDCKIDILSRTSGKPAELRLRHQASHRIAAGRQEPGNVPEGEG